MGPTEHTNVAMSEPETTEESEETLSSPTPGEVVTSGNSSSGSFAAETVIEARNIDVFYGEEQALRDISMSIPKNRVTAPIGPSWSISSYPMSSSTNDFTSSTPSVPASHSMPA